MDVADPLSPDARTYLGDIWLRFRRDPGALVGAGIVLVVLLAAIFAPLIAGWDPLAQDLSNQAQPPNAHHLLGTDKLGRDLFARILYGARISIRIGFVAVGLAITSGTLIGATAGYLGENRRRADGRDGRHARLPFDHSRDRDHDDLGAEHHEPDDRGRYRHIPQYARLARSSVLGVKEMEYIEAARALGVSAPAVLARHILPNILAPLLVQATLGVATAELEAAGLSYLGLAPARPHRSGVRCSTTRATIGWATLGR